MQFGVQLTAATPVASVIANEALGEQNGPDCGAENSTRTPSAGRPDASATVARMVVPAAVAWTVAPAGASSAP